MLEQRQRLRADAAHALAELAVVAIDVVVHQQRDVAAAFAQGRQRHRHHLQSVEEVLTELPRPDLIFQVAVCRGDTDIDADVRQSANPLEGLLFEEPQQLRLGPGVISPISSRNTVPPSAVSNQPALLLPCVGEGHARVRTARFRAAVPATPNR